MRIAVFDAVGTGHHPSWIEPVERALAPLGPVTFFLSDSLAARVPALRSDVEIVPGEAAVDPAYQLDLLAGIARRADIDHLLHLYGIKPVLREWLHRPALAVPTTVVVTHPSSLHYRSVYGTSLTLSERVNAYYKEVLVRRWQRRPDAHSIFTMEEPAVQRWSRPHAAPAYYLPEPPLSSPATPSARPREGVLVCGAIRPQKNIETIARALSAAPPGLHLVIAGDVYPSYRSTVHALADQMRAAGVNVTLRLRWHSSAEILEALARARCLLIPALRHKGTSHTLVEAASAGTPVIVHAGGLLGYTVRRYGLGLAVDCTDPHSLRGAIRELAESDEARLRFAANLAEFAAWHSPEAFSSAICAPFAIPAPRDRSGGRTVASAR